MPDGQGDRGQARRTRIRLNASIASAARLIADHKQTCSRCVRAGADLFKRCDYGWELAKIELRAIRAKEYYEMDHPDLQERLL